MKKLFKLLKRQTIILLNLIVFIAGTAAWGMDPDPNNYSSESVGKKRSLPDGEREAEEPLPKKRRVTPLTYGFDFLATFFQMGIGMLLPGKKSVCNPIESQNLKPQETISYQANLLNDIPDEILLVIMKMNLRIAENLGSTNTHFHRLFCDPRLNLRIIVNTPERIKEILKPRNVRRKEDNYPTQGRYILPFHTTLDLRGNVIGESGAKSLSKANFPLLTTLNLVGNRIGDVGAKSLSKAKFPLLTTLNLWGNRIEDVGALSLSTANFPLLTTLDLGGNEIGGAGALSLSKANFPLLTTLNLRDNRTGFLGALSLSKANFPLLTTLDLGSNVIGESGVESLSRANFPLLTTLDLSSNGIEAAGVESLSRANFPLLTTLNLRDR